MWWCVPLYLVFENLSLLARPVFGNLDLLLRWWERGGGRGVCLWGCEEGGGGGGGVRRGQGRGRGSGERGEV